MCVDKDKLVNYIKTTHRKEKGYEISSVKLNKCLFILYGMWHLNYTLLSEVFRMFPNEYEDLFEGNFEAWYNGPADPEVCKNNKEGKYIDNVELDELIPKNENNLKVLIFIKNITNKVLSLDDFTLMDITKQMKSWKKHYKEDKKNKIPNDYIKNDFCQKFITGTLSKYK